MKQQSARNKKNEQLYAARKWRRWSQESASARIGVDRVTYARWENNEQEPQLKTLDMLCSAFGETPEALGFGHLVHMPTPERRILSFTQSTLITPDLTSATIDLFSTGVLALTLAKQQHNWTFDEIQLRTELEMRRLDSMTQHDQGEGTFSRRQMIHLLMSVPAATFGITQTGPSLLQEDEIISLCAVNIPLAWRLYFAGGLTEVKQILPTYLAKLSSLTRQDSRYQQQVAGLTSQAHQMGYLLALQSQDFSIAQTHAKQAFEFAQIAENPSLLVSSLVRQGNLFFTLKRPVQTMQKYQEAIQHSKGASPLVVGQAYIGLAEAYARLGQKQEALHFSGLAQDTFPDYPENDLHFAYTHFNHFTRANFEGLAFLHLNQPEDAWKSFTQIDKALPQTLIPQRVELLSRQALASVTLGDLEQSCRYTELAATSAIKLGSELRYSEVCETFLDMQNKWPYEKKVKELLDLFQR